MNTHTEGLLTVSPQVGMVAMTAVETVISSYPGDAEKFRKRY